MRPMFLVIRCFVPSAVFDDLFIDGLLVAPYLLGLKE